MENLNPEPLEQTVHAALRALPDRRAPASLAARVEAEIARRAAIPWWHRSYAYWPSWARGTFLAAAGAGVAGIVMFLSEALGLGSGRLAGALKPALLLAHRVYAVAAWTGDFVSLLVGSISPVWLYGGIALIAVMYLSLFGIGATAYRFLWTRR